MKLNYDTLSMPGCFYSMFDTLLRHFEYSIKDISSYNELLPEEKEIIPEYLFDLMTKK